MDIKDWLGVSQQINQIGAMRRQNQALAMEEERNKIYKARNALAQKSAERGWAQEDKAEQLAIDSAKVFDLLRQQEEAGAKQGAGDGGNASALGGRVQQDPLAGFDPEAKRLGMIQFAEYQNKRTLADERVRNAIKAKADALSSEFYKGLTQSAQALQNGNEEAAWAYFIDSYNTTHPGYHLERNKDSKSATIINPAGEKHTFPVGHIGLLIKENLAKAKPEIFWSGLIGDGLASAKYNARAAASGGEPLYDKNTGELVAYGAVMINDDMQREYVIMDGKIGPQSNRITDPEIIARLQTKDEKEAADKVIKADKAAYKRFGELWDSFTKNQKIDITGVAVTDDPEQYRRDRDTANMMFNLLYPKARNVPIENLLSVIWNAMKESEAVAETNWANLSAAKKPKELEKMLSEAGLPTNHDEYVQKMKTKLMYQKILERQNAQTQQQVDPGEVPGEVEAGTGARSNPLTLDLLAEKQRAANQQNGQGNAAAEGGNSGQPVDDRMPLMTEPGPLIDTESFKRFGRGVADFTRHNLIPAAQTVDEMFLYAPARTIVNSQKKSIQRLSGR